MTPTSAPFGRTAPATSGWTSWAVALGTAALALLVRWNLGGRLVGLQAYHGYDEGVYFTSAIEFAHGLMPYRDFLLLHPPGLMLALTPFAALTHWISTSDAFAAARLGFMALGAANTILVSRIALRWSLRAALVAGTLYAVSFAAANSEYATLLEPLGTLCLLGSVAIFQRTIESRASAWWTWVGGAVLGLGLVVKIWDVVPALVVLGWLWIVRGRAHALHAGAAAVVASAGVLAPFGIIAGDRMLHLVVLDQLGRARTSASLVTRLGGLSGADLGDARVPTAAGLALLAVVLAVVVVSATLAWTHRRGRLWVVMLTAQLVVLAASPSSFPTYSAYSAAAATLVIAAGVSVLQVRAATVLTCAACVVVGLATAVMMFHPVAPFPAAQIRAQLPATGCITSDSPGTLVLLDVIDRDLAAGCRVPVDLSGQTYDVGGTDAAGRPVPRIRNAPWQRDVVTYLTSGSAAVIVRGVGDGFDPATRAELGRRSSLVQLRGAQVLVMKTH